MKTKKKKHTLINDSVMFAIIMVIGLCHGKNAANVETFQTEKIRNRVFQSSGLFV